MIHMTAGSSPMSPKSRTVSLSWFQVEEWETLASKEQPTYSVGCLCYKKEDRQRLVGVANADYEVRHSDWQVEHADAEEHKDSG